MTPAEFEEKDFEGPLYNELLLGSRRFATPGQVFENAFGVDAVMEAEHPLFFGLFGFRDIPAGISLPDYRWGWIWRRYGGARTLPSFPVNALIQAKRPDCLKGRNSRLATLGIKGRYWRFAVRAHQQPLLERLERQLRGRALVIYASPAFGGLQELYDHTDGQKLVENTSFVRPSRMSGHHSWNYDSPGTRGIASSEPEKINDVGFYKSLDELFMKTQKSDPKEDIKLLEAAVSETVAEQDGNPIAAHYLKIANRIDSLEERRASRGKAAAFIKVSSFFSLLDLQWAVYGGGAEGKPDVA